MDFKPQALVHREGQAGDAPNLVVPEALFLDTVLKNLLLSPKAVPFRASWPI